jgi:outer membrane protein assembly factor BamB
MRRTPWIVLVATITAWPARGENWPAWRGPEGLGITADHGFPLTWSATENVRWKAPLPGAGNSTPIVWDDRIFLTCPTEEGKRRWLMCFDRADGRLIWQREHRYAEEETTHRDNPFCSGSPVTDGMLVYADFGSAGVVAYDLQGNPAWRRDLGTLTHVWGKASSPVLYRDLLIVYRGPGEPTHLVALDKQTGETVWDVGERAKNSPVFGSWSTPVILQSQGRDDLVLPLPEEIKGFDPLTGRERWRCAGLGTEVYAMPLVGDALVIAVSGHNGPAIGVRLGGEGDVTESHRLWRQERSQQRVGSGVIHEGHLYLSNATGIVECFVASTGEPVWQERVGGTLWGSMLLADGRLYVTSLEGDTYVLAAQPRFQLLAKNSVGEHVKSALAASDGQLFLRSYTNLFCIEGR